MYPDYDSRVLLRPANLYTGSELAQLWSLAYSDYFVDLQFDELRFNSHVAVHDIDLSRSIILETDAGEFIGLSLLAIRGARGWIGGFGVQPKHRRQGHSALLIRSQLAVARGAGLGSVQLEVLAQNWAIKTYERAGFTPSRQLFILRGSVDVTDRSPGVELVSPRVALQQIQQLRCGQVWPWQREFGTVIRSLTSSSIGIVFESNGSNSALVCDKEGERVRILDVAGTPSSMSLLLAALRDIHGHREVVLLNEPADSDLHPYLLTAGLKPVWIQREMVLHFEV